MRARTLILFVVAIVLAGGTAMLVRSWLAQQRATEARAAPMPPPALPQKSVLVARREITRGQILKPEEDLKWRQWPEEGIDPVNIQKGTKRPEDFDRWVARERIGPGDPITETKIVQPGSRGFAAAALHPGMEAVSVPVTPASDVSGFILPGDHVDVVITHALPATGNDPGVQRRAAETVLHDVRVLGVDQKLDSKGGEAIVAHTATLEVTPKQSEILAVASEMGKLSLSLRSLRASPSEETDSDSPADAGPGTYTLDSEVSKLLTQKDTTVTILRGNSKSG
jgi:pilus assembly protein CpaB